MNIFAIFPVWTWLLISGIFFAAGEFLSKKFALSPGWGIFALVILAYALSVTTWLPAIFEKNQLSTTGVIWSLISLMLTVAIGIFLFKEELTLVQALGIFAGIIAITLLSL